MRRIEGEKPQIEPTDQFKGFFGDWKIASAGLNRDGKVSLAVIRRDGVVTNQEELDPEFAVRILRIRKVVAEAEALGLRGAAAISAGAAGLGIAKGFKDRSLLNVAFGVGVGVAAGAAEVGSEVCRVTARSLEARLNRTKVALKSTPQAQAPRKR